MRMKLIARHIYARSQSVTSWKINQLQMILILPFPLCVLPSEQSANTSRRHQDKNPTTTTSTWSREDQDKMVPHLSKFWIETSDQVNSGFCRVFVQVTMATYEAMNAKHSTINKSNFYRTSTHTTTIARHIWNVLANRELISCLHLRFNGTEIRGKPSRDSF